MNFKSFLVWNAPLFLSLSFSFSISIKWLFPLRFFFLLSCICFSSYVTALFFAVYYDICFSSSIMAFRVCRRSMTFDFQNFDPIVLSNHIIQKYVFSIIIHSVLVIIEFYVCRLEPPFTINGMRGFSFLVFGNYVCPHMNLSKLKYLKRSCATHGFIRTKTS